MAAGEKEERGNRKNRRLLGCGGKKRHGAKSEKEGGLPRPRCPPHRKDKGREDARQVLESGKKFDDQP